MVKVTDLHSTNPGSIATGIHLSHCWQEGHPAKIAPVKVIPISVDTFEPSNKRYGNVKFGCLDALQVHSCSYAAL